MWSLHWRNLHSEGLKYSILRETKQLSTGVFYLLPKLLCSCADNIDGRGQSYYSLDRSICHLQMQTGHLSCHTCPATCFFLLMLPLPVHLMTVTSSHGSGKNILSLANTLWEQWRCRTSTFTSAQLLCCASHGDLMLIWHESRRKDCSHSPSRCMHSSKEEWGDFKKRIFIYCSYCMKAY